MARWYLAAFTTGKRYPLFTALKKVFMLKEMADRHTYLGEYKYQEGFERAFRDCVEFIRDIHDIDPINGLDRLRLTLALEKFKVKNKIPAGQEVVFEDLHYKDHFPVDLCGKEKEDLSLLKEMVEDSRVAHADESEMEGIGYRSFYERVKDLEEIICSNESQTSKFDEYSCDSKYWS